jgi:hypothetical protein
MRRIFVRTATRMLVRSATAGAVRIALGAIFLTPHPAIALPSVAGTPTVRCVSTVFATDTEAEGSGLVGAVGPGWG